MSTKTSLSAWRPTTRLLLAFTLLVGCQGNIGGGGGGTPPGPAVPSGQAGGEAEIPGGPSTATCPVSEPSAPLRRLTRTEYANTIAQLFGEAANAALSIPEDDRVGPFRANVLSPVAENAVTQYRDLAERLATSQAEPELALANCSATDGCAEKWVTSFLGRAFRRPVDTTTAAPYVNQLKQEAAFESLVAGFASVIRTALQSPHFLYHVDRGGPPSADGTPRLDAASLAARLSYALQQTPPDAELLTVAANGSLSDPSVLALQVTRLLTTTPAFATATSFHEQWLGLDVLSRLTPDPVKYPGFDEGLRTAMAGQTSQFLLARVGGAGPLFPDLFTAAPSELNAADAAFGGARTGILMLPAFLTTHPTFIQRGKAVRSAVLCQIIPAPPPEAGVLPAPLPGESERDRWVRHVADPACGGCHRLMDPIGFGFEQFDGLGRDRTATAAAPVQALAELVSAGDVTGSYDGAVALSAALAQSQAVQDCFAEQYVRFVLARPLSPADQCAAIQVAERFRQGGLRLEALAQAIASSTSFFRPVFFSQP